MFDIIPNCENGNHVRDVTVGLRRLLSLCARLVMTATDERRDGSCPYV